MENGRDSVFQCAIAGIYMHLLHVRHRTPLSGASPAGSAPRVRAGAPTATPVPWSVCAPGLPTENASGRERERQREKDPGACRTKTVVDDAHPQRTPSEGKGTWRTALSSSLERTARTTPPGERPHTASDEGDSLCGSYGLEIQKREENEGPRRTMVEERIEQHESENTDNGNVLRTMKAGERATTKERGAASRGPRRQPSSSCPIVWAPQCRAHLEISASAPFARTRSVLEADAAGVRCRYHRTRIRRRLVVRSVDLESSPALRSSSRAGSCSHNRQYAAPASRAFLLVDLSPSRPTARPHCRERIARDVASQRGRSRTRGSTTAGRGGRNANSITAHVIVRRFSGGGAKVEAKTRKARAGAKIEAKARTAGVGAGAATRGREQRERQISAAAIWIRTSNGNGGELGVDVDTPLPLPRTTAPTHHRLRERYLLRVYREIGELAPESPMGHALQECMQWLSGVNLETLGTNETAAARYGTRTEMRLRSRKIQYQRSVFDHPGGERKRKEEVAAALRSAKASARKRPPEPRLHSRLRPLYISVREEGKRSTEAMIPLVVVRLLTTPTVLVFMPATHVFFLAPSTPPPWRARAWARRAWAWAGWITRRGSCSIAGRAASRAAQEEEWDAEVEVDVAEEVEASDVDVAAAKKQKLSALINRKASRKREQRNDEEQEAKQPKRKRQKQAREKRLTCTAHIASPSGACVQGVKDALLPVVAVLHADYRTSGRGGGRHGEVDRRRVQGGEQRDSARRYARAKCLRCWWESNRREAARISGEEDVEEEEDVEVGGSYYLRLRLLPVDHATARSETVGEVEAPNTIDHRTTLRKAGRSIAQLWRNALCDTRRWLRSAFAVARIRGRVVGVSRTRKRERLGEKRELRKPLQSGFE
ncbi:hypothetical protein C8R45DRAFT_942539 [Mycena sanguinolenta]|nr:hypothetical protein C8R45DRAFT_942539 [Mycena sanguinolenta]